MGTGLDTLVDDEYHVARLNLPIPQGERAEGETGPERNDGDGKDPRGEYSGP